jgi:hypothetical protein
VGTPVVVVGATQCGVCCLSFVKRLVAGNVLVGLVGLHHGLGSEELLGCDVEAVGVALDRLEKAGLLDR